MAFLVSYQLNGALCDDMGLGKTLQTLVVVQNEICRRNRPGDINLIICPNTLKYHWQSEIYKFMDQGILSCALLSNK